MGNCMQTCCTENQSNDVEMKYEPVKIIRKTVKITPTLAKVDRSSLFRRRVASVLSETQDRGYAEDYSDVTPTTAMSTLSQRGTLLAGANQSLCEDKSKSRLFENTLNL